ncbi:hypothetical protein KPATCC21470_0219 [Kitasatospora purpeofusca]
MWSNGGGGAALSVKVAYELRPASRTDARVLQLALPEGK